MALSKRSRSTVEKNNVYFLDKGKGKT